MLRLNFHFPDFSRTSSSFSFVSTSITSPSPNLNPVCTALFSLLEWESVWPSFFRRKHPWPILSASLHQSVPPFKLNPFPSITFLSPKPKPTESPTCSTLNLRTLPFLNTAPSTNCSTSWLQSQLMTRMPNESRKMSELQKSKN